MSHRRRGRSKHQPKLYKTRLEARIADFLANMKATGDFAKYEYHKPGSQNRNK